MTDTTSFTIAESDADAVAKLRRHHAEVLALFMQGCTYEKIAEIINRPVGTVRSRLHRARAAIIKAREPQTQET